MLHKLIEKHIEDGVGVCQKCGPVKLYERLSKGKVAYRCAIAVEEQRDSPRRHTGAHGFSTTEAQALREGKVCQICGHDRHLVVDHDHTSLVTRGILCRYCNSGLGFFRDNPKLMREGALYLEMHVDIAS